MSSRYDGPILAAVDEYWTENCRPPSLREIMALAGVPSLSTARYAVDGLVERGRLLRRRNGPGSSRTLVPLWVADAVGQASGGRPAAKEVGDG